MLYKFNFQSITLLSLCLPSSDVPHTCQKAAGWRLVQRLNIFGERCLSRICYPVIWQLTLAQLASEFACSQRELVQRFGGPTAPSTDSIIKEFRSAAWDGE